MDRHEDDHQRELQPVVGASFSKECPRTTTLDHRELLVTPCNAATLYANPPGEETHFYVCKVKMRPRDVSLSVMKIFRTTSVAGMLLLMPACTNESRHPELSAQLRAGLVQVGTSDVFVSALKNIRPEPSIESVGLPCVKACATTDIMWAQVSYPITVCYPPQFSTENIIAMYKQGREPDSLAAIIASNTAVTHQVNVRIGTHTYNLFCKTHGGPWFAEILDQESCSRCGPGPHRFAMTILGVEQNLYWEWWGTLDGRPPEVEFYGAPWSRGQSVLDCNPTDLTNCSSATSSDQPAFSPAQLGKDDPTEKSRR